MGKKVLTRQDVDKLYFEGTKEIYIDDETIVLPGAKDALMAAGIKVRTKDCQVEQIKKIIEECCDEKEIADSMKNEIIKSVIAKCDVKI
ncbi:MAG: hypothetical protein GXW90_03060 [Tepidanaerobacter acetatoxydans]|uniref:hypothetical protein n=1 Tax=Tepidanaerobacter TaxID=499228 RepID=UPI000AFD3EC6|nr:MULTISPECIES: hypothetical protein [Tepidanaerobacter]NLU09919.1 hypothetical protein [Tepidanaerobacter acetatoxydans]